MTGLRYAFSPPGSLNSVMSASHSSFGAPAWKSRPARLGGRVRYLPLVGAVAPPPLQVGNLAALFGHQPAHDLLADDDAAFPQLVVHVPVAPRAAGAVEYPPDVDPELGVPVLRAQLRAAVLIGALRDPQGIGELS